MDRETEQYYNAIKDMMATDGWKVFSEELKTNAVNINSVEGTKDRDDLYFRKGQLNILASILNLESTLEHMKQEGSNDSIWFFVWVWK